MKSMIYSKVTTLSKWQKVKIGDFLKRKKRTVEITDEKTYKRVTIKTNHQGVNQHDKEISVIFEAIKQLMEPVIEESKNRIGFIA